MKLSAEVEPFIPQKKGLEGALVSMSLSGEPGGGGEGGGGLGGVNGAVETTPIPSYLITCYPFVQENQPNRYCHSVTARRGVRVGGQERVKPNHSLSKPPKTSCGFLPM